MFLWRWNVEFFSTIKLIDIVENNYCYLQSKCGKIRKISNASFNCLQMEKIALIARFCDVTAGPFTHLTEHYLLLLWSRTSTTSSPNLEEFKRYLALDFRKCGGWFEAIKRFQVIKNNDFWFIRLCFKVISIIDGCERRKSLALRPSLIVIGPLLSLRFFIFHCHV